jgi:hypothetical protein
VLALSEMIINSGEAGHFADQKKRLQKFVCDMRDVLQKAREQGSPIQRGLITQAPEARKVKLKRVDIEL